MKTFLRVNGFSGRLLIRMYMSAQYNL